MPPRCLRVPLKSRVASVNCVIHPTHAHQSGPPDIYTMIVPDGFCRASLNGKCRYNEEVEFMTKLFAVYCCIAIFAGVAVPIAAQEQQQPLRLMQTIPLPGVKGRLDHMGVDLAKKRLFVAAGTNTTLAALVLTRGQ